jgi:protein SCO1/2
VSITAPTSGSLVVAPWTGPIEASVADPDGTVTSISFFAGGTLLGSVPNPPASVIFNAVNLGAGSFNLTAVATDNAGASTTSLEVPITVLPANVPPSVVIIAPTGGATLAAPWNGTIRVNVFDPDGTVTDASFFAGATLLGSIHNPPANATFNLTNLAAGDCDMTSVAKDSAGASTTSASVHIKVVNAVPIMLSFPHQRQRGPDVSGATFQRSSDLGVPRHQRGRGRDGELHGHQRGLGCQCVFGGTAPESVRRRRSGLDVNAMRSGELLRLLAPALLGLVLVQVPGESRADSGPPGTNTQVFMVQGLVKEVQREPQTVLIAHEAIPGYMDAMTMPFKAKNASDLQGLQPGARISFRLVVNETTSWIDQISRIGSAPAAAPHPAPAQSAEAPPPPPPPRHPLLTFRFTNELGQPVSLSDFKGQALAITFFFTRCPIPDYCPRLSKNFQEAAQKLQALPGAPTNWHFLSVSFDTGFDTPAVLKAYGERYHYDPKRWSFLTGPADKIGELARLSDVTFEPAGGFLNHNFRTLIIDAAGHLQMTFPVGGDLTEAIVSEMLKAATATHRPT